MQKQSSKEKIEQEKRDYQKHRFGGPPVESEKSPVDQIFDELVGKLLTFVESLGFVEDRKYSTSADTIVEFIKGKAVHSMVRTFVREAQNRLKEEYSKLNTGK